MNTNEIKTGIIYKLCSLNSEKCYIGSTTQKLTKRLSVHKNHYKMYLQGNNKNYITSFEICKAGNPFIIELERVIGNKQSILARERHYIENTSNVVNKNIAGRTQVESSKAYYENNKEKIQEYLHDYYENNKEKLQEYKQEYYKLNREKNKEKLQTKNICDICGGKFTTHHKSTHLKSLKHIKAKTH
jgi:hypothetical protein